MSKGLGRLMRAVLAEVPASGEVTIDELTRAVYGHGPSIDRGVEVDYHPDWETHRRAIHRAVRALERHGDVVITRTTEVTYTDDAGLGSGGGAYGSGYRLGYRRAGALLVRRS
jgi:hypothetical protein